MEIVLAISMRGVFGGMPMAVSSCWGDLVGEYILRGIGRNALK